MKYWSILLYIIHYHGMFLNLRALPSKVEEPYSNHFVHVCSMIIQQNFNHLYTLMEYTKKKMPIDFGGHKVKVILTCPL